ncbi:MAG: hypothetical protein EZS28_009945 [Streblomastix strix]|uniref:SPRY domain-containing protein n=1 Tax=Streblomastix strix TaxID=222440 RepID=A0A5J4WJN4_9EUKA|nr:MAG: hypothetical protein EZS28_009945 [Streblomastix strix]
MSGPIPHTFQNPSPQDIKAVGDTFTHNNTGSNDAIITFDTPIKNGKVRFEVLCITTLQAVGIADESVRFEKNWEPDKGGKNKIVQFWSGGGLIHVASDQIEGNDNFEKEGQRVALELDMDSKPHTLTFFVDDKEQPLYVTKIPASVKFWAYTCMREASFKLIKFERIPAATAKHSSGSRALEWGKKWK